MPPTPARRGGALKIILPIVVVLLLVCCVGGGFALYKAVSSSSSSAGDAQVGDCLKGKKIDQSSDKFQDASLTKTDCSATDALYKVVGRVADKTQSQAATDDNICSAYADATSLYWFGKTGQKGTVLCLKNAK
jgi:hypothetical protein